MHAKVGSSSMCMRVREQFFVHAKEGADTGACEGGSSSRCM